MLAIQVLDQKVIKVVERQETDNYRQDNEETFSQSTQVTDQVKNAVDVPIDAIEGQIKLKSHLHVRAIFELIWAAYCPSVAKYSRFVFCQLAELVIFVLQLQISELNFINDFLAQLGVYWNPFNLSFS